MKGGLTVLLVILGVSLAPSVLRAGDAGDVWQNPDPRTTRAFRLIDAEEVARYWVNTFPHVPTLDRNYHRVKRSYERLIALINSGQLQEEAETAALEWNAWMYERHGYVEEAKAARALLAEWAAIDATLAKQEAEAATAMVAIPTRFNVTDPSTGGYGGWVEYDPASGVAVFADPEGGRRSGRVLQYDDGSYQFQMDGSGRRYDIRPK